jgi:tetratricopeptide (TPR) repeat protein
LVAQQFVLKKLQSDNIADFGTLDTAKKIMIRTADLMVIRDPYVILGLVVMAVFILIAVSKMPQAKDAGEMAPLKSTFSSLFENENYDEAIQEYFKTQKNSELDLERHSAFHNLGNSYMKKKDYAQAVEAYKNALRSNSEDDETRYNYALAKEFLEGDKRQNSQDNSETEDEKKDKSEDKKENEEENQNSDQNSDSNKEMPDEKDEDKEKDEGGGLSKQQMENLLEAVNNIEKDLNQKLKSGKK